MKLRDATIRVIDFETTGFDPEEERICEVGWCDVTFKDGSWQSSAPLDSLVNPGKPIPAVAMAVHHITNDDVEFYRRADEILPEVFHTDIDLYAAHNAEFDRAFAGDYGGDAPWLCTYRLSLHEIPDAPSHKNQVLRYHLGFFKVAGDAHRAGHDAKVTALILCHMLNNAGNHQRKGMKLYDKTTIEAVIDYAESPVLLIGKTMNFGKYSDRAWEECPHDYLQWMKRQGAKSEHNPDGWDRDQWYTLNKLLNGR